MRNTAQNLRFLDDLAKMAGGAFGAMGDLRGHVKSLVNTVLSELDLVTRAEFERVEALAQKARERQVELEKRLAALEKTKTKKTTPAKSKQTSSSKKGKKK